MRELERQFKPRGPRKKAPVAVERRFHVAADREPKVTTRLERVDRGNGQAHWEVVVEIDGVRAGARALPPPLKGRATKIQEARVSEDQLAEQLTGFVPDHLGFNATPRDQLKRLRTIRAPVARRACRHDRLRHRQPPCLSGHDVSVVDGRAGADQPRHRVPG